MLSKQNSEFICLYMLHVYTFCVRRKSLLAHYVCVYVHTLNFLRPVNKTEIPHVQINQGNRSDWKGCF